MALAKPELIREMKSRNKYMSEQQVENVVETMLHHLTSGLVAGKRIEIRDFATFQVRHYKPRKARNPKTGESVMVGDRFKPVCQPGKKLRERVNNSRNNLPA